MKPSVFNRISTAVLWFCTAVTLVLSIWLYLAYSNQSIDVESPEISALLSWLFFLLIITLFTGLIFSFFHYIRLWKENPGNAGRFLIVLSVFGLLLLINWVLGNGEPLPLIGYKGNENTYLWLKITDMWLYTLYILLGVGLLALFGGIIWSYFKKVD